MSRTNKNIKVLTMNAYFSPFRGGETIAYATYKMLKNNGIQSFYMANKRKPYFEKDYEYIRYFTKDITSTKEYLKAPWKYYTNFSAKNDVKRIIDKIQPDLIHVHNIITGFSPIVLQCCKDIPTVMTVHDSGIICPASTLMYKNKHFCNDLKCKQGQILNCLFNKCDNGKLEPSIRKTIRSYFILKNLKYINKFITPSYALKDLLIKADIGIKNENISVINNFLPDEKMTITPNYTNKNYFLYIGSLSKEKGVNYLLEAIKELPLNIEFHIAGGGKEEISLKQFVEKNNLKNVKFLGFLNQEQAHNEYQDCIATILPCYWFENFPTTIMESFINGKPVIASNIGGISEMIENNQNGLLFEPTNIEQLKKGILTYWENQNLVVEHGRKGYLKALNNYTEQIFYNQTL